MHSFHLVYPRLALTPRGPRAVVSRLYKVQCIAKTAAGSSARQAPLFDLDIGYSQDSYVKS